MFRSVYLILVSFFIFSCVQINNLIGYEFQFDSPVDRRCIVSVLSKHREFTEFSEIERKLTFDFLDNEIEFSFQSNGNIDSYLIEVDGMFSGKDYTQFVREAETLKELVLELIRKDCLTKN